MMEYIGLVNPQTTLEERLRHAFIQENLLKHIWDQGVRYGATCLLRSDEDDVPRLTTAQFTASLILADVPGNDPLSTLEKSL
ncbi:hypothetical protein [Halopolyspora algeriensis]|nr:hypothetical protein [Halopolyspora algeriensis]